MYPNLSVNCAKLVNKKEYHLNPLTRDQTHHPLQRVLNVWGPISVKGRNNERFFSSKIDDFSCRVVIYSVRNDAQVFNICQRHISRAEKFIGLNLYPLELTMAVNLKIQILTSTVVKKASPMNLLIPLHLRKTEFVKELTRLIVAKSPDFGGRLRTTLNIQQTFTLNSCHKI